MEPMIGKGPLDIDDTDNRDFNTTWLWVNKEEGWYVEVRPVELLRNAIENLPEGPETKLMNMLLDLIVRTAEEMDS